MLPNEQVSGMDRATESSNAQYVQHGRGKQSWADGSKYEGEWRNGMAHGIGLIQHPNGDQYEGEFMNGQANGFGAYIYANGQK